MDIKNIYDAVIFASTALSIKDALIEAVSKKADLYGANLGGADLRGADLGRKKIIAMRVFTGLYNYQVWAVLYEDEIRAVRMGCLFYDLDKWETIGIRKSNLSEFPDDGSERSENRAAAFDFAKAAALRMLKP